MLGREPGEAGQEVGAGRGDSLKLIWSTWNVVALLSLGFTGGFTVNV